MVKNEKTSLRDRIKTASKIKETSILSESKIYIDQDMITTPIPILNAAFSGSLTGGFVPGVTQICGPSKHFKTGLALLMAKAFMDKYPDSLMLFYISEFGSPISYFEQFNIDQDRVIITPVTDLEILKSDISNQLKELTREDKIIIMIDSIGNLASRKEVEDALKENVVTDFTRAKAIRSLFRIITPHLTLKDIPLLAINHSYKTIEMYSKDKPGGGDGIYYASDNIYMMGRQQEKETSGDDKGDLLGYNFILKAEKSRYVKEQSKFPLEVTFKDGISKWSGLLDLALESGHVVKPSNGWYQKLKTEKKYRENDTNSDEFWEDILDDVSFNEFVENKFRLI